MRQIWHWIEDNATPITVAIALLGGFAAVLQFSVVRPMQQGFNAVNQRIDDQIQYVNQRLNDQDRSINQRFDAMDQRFDDQDRSINQRFDDQNLSINQRFDDQNVSINQRFDDQDRSINQRFDAQDKYINQRFDAQDRRIEDLIKDVAELRGLSDRVTRNETRIDALSEQVQAGDAPSP